MCAPSWAAGGGTIAVAGGTDFAAAGGVDTTPLGAWVFINLSFTIGFGVAAQRFKEAGGAFGCSYRSKQEFLFVPSSIRRRIGGRYQFQNQNRLIEDKVFGMLRSALSKRGARGASLLSNDRSDRQTYGQTNFLADAQTNNQNGRSAHMAKSNRER